MTLPQCFNIHVHDNDEIKQIYRHHTEEVSFSIKSNVDIWFDATSAAKMIAVLQAAFPDADPIDDAIAAKTMEQQP